MLPQSHFQARPLPFDEDLETMLTEIATPNQDAFREILRMEPLSGRPRPRLAYARNFFGSLEDMARYWDTSADNYYHVPVDQKLDHNTSVTSAGKAEHAVEVDGTKDDVTMTDFDSANKSDVKYSASSTKEVYKGYRFGSGDQLNPGTRVALVKNFLKMVTHKFTCRDHEPMPAPREKLTIRGVRVQSIQYHFCIARIPRDSKLARARLVEGPLMAVHCREETRFKQTPSLPTAESLLSETSADGASVSRPAAPTKPLNSKPPPINSSFVGERFDLFREVGCMLILACQRNREGKDKIDFSGANKWWVEKPRWGNGPVNWGQIAIEAYEDEDPSWSPEEKKIQEEKRIREIEQKERGKDVKDLLTGAKMGVDELMANNAPSLQPKPGDPFSGPRKKKLRSLDRPPGKEEELRDGRKLMYVPPFKKKWYQDWQKLRPNTPMWDDKVMYKHIGRAEDAGFDDIYMLTCVNHHIALVRMRVHPEYLDWIENGHDVTSDKVEGLRKDVLHVQRSTWYNMFRVEERSELLVTVWRLMCYLSRDIIDNPEIGKADQLRKAQ